MRAREQTEVPLRADARCGSCVSRSLPSCARQMLAGSTPFIDGSATTMDTKNGKDPSRRCLGSERTSSMLGIRPLWWNVLLGLLTAALITACAAPPGSPRAATAGEAPLPTPQPGAVTVESARIVSAVVADEQPYFATLSPDGTQIACFNETGRGKERNGRICLFSFANASKRCYDFPAGKFLGYPVQLQWSPDSKRIAFTENPLQLVNDPDIWVMNVAEGTYADLTDDGVTGNWQYQAGAPQALVDYLPMWNAADGRIYFWRVLPQ